MRKKFELQADQYQFPYHYLVDLEAQSFGRTLDWGLDYYTYMRTVSVLVKEHVTTSILDVGCGDGFLLYNLARDPDLDPGVRMLGVDVDEKPIKFAQAFAHDFPNVSFRAQDIATLDEPFPLITVVETLEHIPDDLLPSFTAHIDRLLEPGGLLILSVPSKTRPVIEKHYRHYDPAMLRAYFPTYEILATHFVSARNSLLYKVVSSLLTGRHLNLNFGVFKRALLRLHERLTSDVTADRGAHIVQVLRKP